MKRYYFTWLQGEIVHAENETQAREQLSYYHMGLEQKDVTLESVEDA